MPLALSPDGSRFVYTGQGPDGIRVLFLRPVDQLEATVIPGTASALAPAFAPDGRSLAYTTFGGPLHIVSLDGGPPLTLYDSAASFGGSWGDDGMIYFTSTNTRGVSRISASGGVPEHLTTPDTASGVSTHRFAQVLPDGEGVLFTAWSGNVENADIAVLSLGTGDITVLVRGTYARYAASGHLIYTRADGALLAAPFDAGKLELTGPSTPLLENIIVNPGGLGHFAISASGHLLYLTGEGGGNEQLAWVDRTGDETLIPIEPDNYALPRLSPDGTRVALTIGATGVATAGDIWVYRLDPPTRSRLTFEAENNYPSWSPDGRRVMFNSDREGTRALYAKPADGSGPAELVLSAGTDLWEGLWSPDGHWVIARDNVGGERSIFYTRPGVDTTLRAFGLREFQERTPTLSPDGRWIAYTSNESGIDEIYVRPFPDPGGKWQVSNGGGNEPAWAHSGRELFYRSSSTLMVVQVETQPTFSTGLPTALFEVGGYNTNAQRTSYDVDRNDERFLFVKGSPEDVDIVVVLNWFEEVKERTRN